MKLNSKYRFQICANLFWRGLNVMEVIDELESTFYYPHHSNGNYGILIRTTKKTKDNNSFMISQREYSGTWYEENQRK